MPAPIALAAIPIITAAGRFAAPYLAKELGKLGMNKFVSTYGKGAFNTLESLIKNTTMVKPEAMPMVNPEYNKGIKSESVATTGAGLVIGGAPKEVLPPPEPFTTPEDRPTDTTLSTPIPTPIDTTVSTPIPQKQETKLSTPIPEPEGPIVFKKDDVKKQTENLIRGIGDNNPPSAIEEETTVSKTTPREYKGEIIETTSLNENLKDAIAEYAGTPEDIAKSLKMPQSHKRKIYIQLEEFLNKNYPSKLSAKEQEVESDALFYIANSVYDIYTFRGEGMPQDTLMVQDDIGFPLATAEIERYPKGKVNYYPKRKKGNRYVKTEPAIYIETIGSLNKNATSKILDQVEKIAESEGVRYIVAEDLTSEAAAKAFEKRGFVPAKKGFFEGDIINEAEWRGGKKNVKQKNMVLDLGKKYQTTEKEIAEDFIKEQTDNLLKNK